MPLPWAAQSIADLTEEVLSISTPKPNGGGLAAPQPDKLGGITPFPRRESSRNLGTQSAHFIPNKCHIILHFIISVRATTTT